MRSSSGLMETDTVYLFLAFGVFSSRLISTRTLRVLTPV